MRLAVARRPTFDNIGDIDRRLPGVADGSEHAIQQLARGANKGFATLVLLLARTLADQHQISSLHADAEDGLRARLVQGAGGAARDLFAQGFPLRRDRLPVLAGRRRGLRHRHGIRGDDGRRHRGWGVCEACVITSRRRRCRLRW